MPNLKVPIHVKGKATVEIPSGLTDEEKNAAEDMAEFVATALLMSINSHQLADQNISKMKEYADKHGITVSRAQQIFKSIWVSNVKAETGIGPMDMDYKQG